MKKIIPMLTYSNTSNIIDKITYNGKENSNEININFTIKENTLLDNFKFEKNNNIKANIELVKENGNVNLVVTNEKTNPFSFSFTFDLGSSELILKENKRIKTR